MGKTNQGNSTETNRTQKITRYLHHEQNVASNYKGTRASKDRSRNTDISQITISYVSEQIPTEDVLNKSKHVV
jgi:hypothetical protein